MNRPNFKTGQDVRSTKLITFRSKRKSIPVGSIGKIVSKAGCGMLLVKFDDEYGRANVFPADLEHLKG